MATTRKKSLQTTAHALLAGLCVALLACGTEDDSGFTLPQTDTGFGAFDAGSLDGIYFDAGVASDTTQVDSGGAATETDAGAISSDAGPQDGLPGSPCKTNDDCDSNTCIDTPKGNRCAKKCVDTCSGEFACKQLPGSDASYYCLPKWLHTCEPCTTSSACEAPGFSGAACIDRGNSGNFCGSACDDSGDCPGGYACALVTSVEGSQSQQCMPKAGAQCACSDRAKKLTLATTCKVKLDVGTCAGVRACGPTGLADCDAKPTKEACNGLDDDCNGKTDEALCDDANTCTTDACDPSLTLAGGCTHTAAPGACDADDNACTEGDICAAGVCKTGKTKSCDDSNPCTLDACLPASGCTQTVDDGKSCTDDNACTTGDVCLGGSCKAGTTTVCKPGGFCVTAACSKTDGSCKETAKSTGTPCSDDNACTSGDACATGKCGGKAIECDDKNLCTTDSCDPVQGCKSTANQQPCDDGNACTIGDVCLKSSCSAGVATKCTPSGFCVTAACSKTDGNCKETPKSAGTPCTDDNACTSADACTGGKCGGKAVVCDDKNPCTTDSCHPVLGCQSKASAQACDDGNACTAADSCTGGLCTGKAIDAKAWCDDGNPCTTDTCNPKGGAATPKPGCVHTNNKLTCDDGNECTKGDVCATGKCVGGNNLCQCTKDADCGVKEDGDLCNGTLFCDKSAAPYKCAVNPKTLVTCSKAGDSACKAAKCVPKTGTCGLASANEGQPCDADGSVCTLGDLCLGGNCKPGKALGCDDGNPCTKDSCDAKKGCGSTKLADKSSCGTTQWCMAGTCVQSQWCGDGKVNQGGEQCDDGNTLSGDGCSKDCQKEAAIAPLPGSLIITEIMPDPTTAQKHGEWFEIHNTTKVAIKLTGLEIADGFAKELIKTTGLILDPGGYFVFGRSQTLGGGGKANYVYSNTMIALNNNGDSVILRYQGQVIDSVKYGGKGWLTVPNGKTYQLSPTKMTATANDSGSAWCIATVVFGSTGDKGTPGKKNSDCK